VRDDKRDLREWLVDRVQQPIIDVERLYGRLSPFSTPTFFFSLGRSGTGSGLEGKERLMGPRLGLDRLFISDRLFSVDSVSATQECY